MRSCARAALTLVALVLVVLAAGAVEDTQAAWTSAVVAHPTGSAKTGRLAFTHTYATGPSCVGEGPAAADCSGAPIATGPATATSQTVNDALSNQTAGGGSFTQQVAVTACAPARFANSATATDPLLPRYRVARMVTDPWGGTSAASFNGTSHYATDVVPTTTSLVSSGSYTVGLWFKAAPGSSGGGLLSLNASPIAATSAGANPTVSLDSAGRLRAKFDGTPILILPLIVTSVSPTGVDYRDGAWHHVALTVRRNLLSTGLVMYVDGKAVDTQTGLALLVGTFTDAYWHVGWTDTTAIAGSPAAYFTGSLSGVFTTSSAMTAAQVDTLYGAASSGAYAAAVVNPQHVWMLGDAPSDTFGGTIGYVTGGNACGHVRLGWTLGATSAFAPTALNSLPALGWQPSTPAAVRAADQTLSTTYSRISSGYDGDVTGLELVATLAHRVMLTGSTWVLPFRWTAVLLG